MAVKSPRFPFEVTECRMKTFFRRPLSRQGDQDSIQGPRIVGEDLSFLFWRRQHPNGRLGAHTGECCPHQTAKLFRTKSQQEV